MSISSSLNNALSGLNIAARSAEIVSANVANSLTDGYGRRTLEVGSVSLGGSGAGVRAVGVHRSVDHAVISERRLADAELGDQSARANFLQNLENAIGQPDDLGSLTGLLAQLDSNLIEAASRPDSAVRLNAVFEAASGVTNHINSISSEIQQLRLKADHEIVGQVESLNAGLSKVKKLNIDIRKFIGAGRDATALMDQRQQQIDRISSIVPLRTAMRDHGQIALYTTGGAILLDGSAAEIGFVSVNTVVPEMTQASGGLSGLTINGNPISTGARSSLTGGSLAGLFAVRDELSVTAQSNLDAVARDLIERFADTNVDPTLGIGDAGLFTDAGIAFDAMNEIGVSERLSINALVDPSNGGDLWKLRDGLGATVSGPPGDSARLTALGNALTNIRAPMSDEFLGSSRSAAGLSGEFLSLVHSNLQSTQDEQSFASAQVSTLKTIELQGGVDTDQELQQLLLIEQAFSANARVISTADDMIQTLLRL